MDGGYQGGFWGRFARDRFCPLVLPLDLPVGGLEGVRSLLCQVGVPKGLLGHACVEWGQRGRPGCEENPLLVSACLWRRLPRPRWSPFSPPDRPPGHVPRAVAANLELAPSGLKIGARLAKLPCRGLALFFTSAFRPSPSGIPARTRPRARRGTPGAKVPFSPVGETSLAASVWHEKSFVMILCSKVLLTCLYFRCAVLAF